MTHSESKITKFSLDVIGCGSVDGCNFNNMQISETFLSVASNRLQLLPAINSARTNGAKINYYDLGESSPDRIINYINSEVCIVGKISSNNQERINKYINANLAGLMRHKASGGKVIVLNSDDMFSAKDGLSDFYLDLFWLADKIIVPTKSLRRSITKKFPTELSVDIINDPWQIGTLHPRKHLDHSDTVSLIWFGSNKNILYLLNYLPKLIKNSPSHRQYSLTLLAHPWALRKSSKYIKSLSGNLTNWQFVLKPWNTKNHPCQLENALKNAHISLLPTNHLSEKVMNVSHNRMVDSLRGGCLPIASPVESYLEFSNCALVGDNICDLFNYAIANYNSLTAEHFPWVKILTQKFDPTINQIKWGKIWKSLI